MLGQHLQLPCEVLGQLERDLVSTNCLVSHSAASSWLLTVNELSSQSPERAPLRRLADEAVQHLARVQARRTGVDPDQ